MALAVVFEQMTPGAISTPWTGRPVPLEDFNATIEEVLGTIDPHASTAGCFGAAGLTHMKSTAGMKETFAAIRAKIIPCRDIPKAVLRNVVGVEDVMKQKIMWPGVMTRSMACPRPAARPPRWRESLRKHFAERNGLRNDVKIAKLLPPIRRASLKARTPFNGGLAGIWLGQLPSKGMSKPALAHRISMSSHSTVALHRMS
ncbi:MAG: hypothetical protein IPO11_20140 [Betaproteobacteria bacterium]|nr:hypothetical protein [Betaproteobacteria bacterium]